MQKELVYNMKTSDYLCVTADIWSSAHRSFFGMTAHWVGYLILTLYSVQLLPSNGQ